MKFLVSVLLLLYISCLTYAQDGTLDISFGIGGKSKTDFNSFNDICRSIAQQSDGKILLAGYSNNGSNDDIAIIRYNYDGSLDNTFGNNGKVTTSIGNSYDRGFGVATQSDGKIVVTGYYSNGNDDDFFVVRYNNDGTLDTTFDHDGKVITDISLNNDRAVSVAIQSDEKIVVGGFAYNLGNFDFALVRYNSDGSLDLNFNSDGIVLTDIGSAENVGLSVVIQSDGKIILAGDSNFGNGYDFTIARYNSDGSLDNTFSEDGIVTTTIGPSDDYCYSIKVQNDEKIIAAGYTFNGSNYDFVIVRYNSDGSLDSEFDNDGIVTTIFGLNSADNAYGVAVQPDEKIVVAGYTYLQTDLDFAVARYHNNGSLDSSFNYNGKIVLADTLDNGAYCMLIQEDGKIVLGGFSNNGHDRDFAVVRLNNPSLPVELISFTGFIVNKNVNLNWITSTELNNMGFMIERSIDKISWATIGFREGKGTTSEPQHYYYSDDFSEITASKLYYRLKQIDFNGTYEYSDIVEVDIAPITFSLEQNFPNPFNPSTKINWQSPVNSWQTLKVYDVLGNEVATLINEYRNAGSYEVDFNAANLPSGVYFYQLKAGEFIQSKKMNLIK